MKDLASIIEKYEGELAHARVAGEPDDWGFPVSKQDLRSLLHSAKYQLDVELSIFEQMASVCECGECDWNQLFTPESLI